MAKIVIAKIKEKEEYSENSIHQIAPCYVQKYIEHKIKQEALQELATGVLLKKYLCIHCDEQLEYNNYKKPYFLSKEKYFNVSHSDEFVVLAISDCEVGIDIEKIRPIHWPTAKKVFDRSKVEYLNGLSEKMRAEQYTKYWTEYEAILKCQGIGFSSDWEHKKERANKYIIKSMRYQNYIITCALEKETEIEVEEFIG